MTTKVTINQADLSAAAEAGLIGQSRVDPLWRYLSHEKKVQDVNEAILIQKATEVNFTTMGVLLGAVILLSPLIWLAWRSQMQRLDYVLMSLFAFIYAIAFGFSAFALKKHAVKIYTPIFNYLLVFLLSICVYGFLNASKLSLNKDLIQLIAEGVCVLASVLVYSAYRQKSILFISTWVGLIFVSDAYHLWANPGSFEGLRYVVWIYGAALLLLGKGAELLQKSRSQTFWIMTVGALSFWGGSTVIYDINHLWQFAWFALNIALCGVSLYFKRYIFLVLGLCGVVFYMFDVFYNLLSLSLGIMLGISILGVVVIVSVLCLQRFYATKTPA